MSIMDKLIPKNIAGILGVVQAVCKFVREICVAAVRLFGFWIPDEPYEAIIVKVGEVADKVDAFIEKYKNMLL